MPPLHDNHLLSMTVAGVDAQTGRTCFIVRFVNRMEAEDTITIPLKESEVAELEKLLDVSKKLAKQVGEDKSL